MSPTALPRRKVTRVAVGVLIRGDGCVLLADRPAGKPYAGYWEFPGGKIEPGEDVAAALERELHEELGVDVGFSVPWVTFEFDYPHAYVELQFRLVHEWRGEPHAREGQQLRFVDPAAALPQPLLPAAVPTLRWLLLPRAVFVIDLPGTPALAAAAGSRWVGRNGAAPLVVVDSDWRATGARAGLIRLRNDPAMRQHRLLASGPGAQCCADGDGVVLEAGEAVHAGLRATGLRGAWVDSVEDLKVASTANFDFVLVRTAALAGQLRRYPAPLPAYLLSDKAATDSADDARWAGQGQWIDLRPPATRG
jgi:8-oxo-dGTP diphosphatase